MAESSQKNRGFSLASSGFEQPFLLRAVFRKRRRRPALRAGPSVPRGPKGPAGGRNPAEREKDRL